MRLPKWSYTKHKYITTTVRSGYYSTFEMDMSKEVTCPHCGRTITFGCSYTSMEFQTPVLGFGYAVCEQCYQDEWKRRYEYEQMENTERKISQQESKDISDK